MGILADLVSLFINLNVCPKLPHLLDPVEAGFVDDGGVVVLRSTDLVGIVPNHVVGINRRVTAIFRATADGNVCRFCRRAILCRVPPASVPGECILNRLEASPAQHHAIALPQGWMVILLNLIRADGIVPMIVVGKRKSCMWQTNKGLPLLFSFRDVLP